MNPIKTTLRIYLKMLILSLVVFSYADKSFSQAYINGEFVVAFEDRVGQDYDMNDGVYSIIWDAKVGNDESTCSGNLCNVYMLSVAITPLVAGGIDNTELRFEPFYTQINGGGSAEDYLYYFMQHASSSPTDSVIPTAANGAIPLYNGIDDQFSEGSGGMRNIGGTYHQGKARAFSFVFGSECSTFSETCSSQYPTIDTTSSASKMTSVATMFRLFNCSQNNGSQLGSVSSSNVVMVFDDSPSASDLILPTEQVSIKDAYDLGNDCDIANGSWDSGPCSDSVASYLSTGSTDSESIKATASQNSKLSRPSPSFHGLGSSHFSDSAANHKGRGHSDIFSGQFLTGSAGSNIAGQLCGVDISGGGGGGGGLPTPIGNSPLVAPAVNIQLEHRPGSHCRSAEGYYKNTYFDQSSCQGAGFIWKSSEGTVIVASNIEFKLQDKTSSSPNTFSPHVVHNEAGLNIYGMVIYNDNVPSSSDCPNMTDSSDISAAKVVSFGGSNQIPLSYGLTGQINSIFSSLNNYNYQNLLASGSVSGGSNSVDVYRGQNASAWDIGSNDHLFFKNTGSDSIDWYSVSKTSTFTPAFSMTDFDGLGDNTSGFSSKVVCAWSLTTDVAYTGSNLGDILQDSATQMSNTTRVSIAYETNSSWLFGPSCTNGFPYNSGSTCIKPNSGLPGSDTGFTFNDQNGRRWVSYSELQYQASSPGAGQYTISGSTSTPTWLFTNSGSGYEYAYNNSSISNAEELACVNNNGYVSTLYKDSTVSAVPSDPSDGTELDAGDCVSVENLTFYSCYNTNYSDYVNSLYRVGVAGGDISSSEATVLTGSGDWSSIVINSATYIYNTSGYLYGNSALYTNVGNCAID